MHYKTITVSLNIQREELLANWRFLDNTSEWSRLDQPEFTGAMELSESREKLDYPPADVQSTDRGAPRLLNIEVVGEEIFGGLFSAGVIAASNMSISSSSSDGIRILFEIPQGIAPELASLPLEAMRTPAPKTMVGLPVSEYLVLTRKLSLARRIQGGTRFDTGDLGIDLPLRVLVFGSDPKNLPERYRLDVEGEMNGICEALEGLGDDVQVEFVKPGKATFDAIDRRARPAHVFHFIGHGRVSDGMGEILLDDGNGGMDWRRIKDVAQLLLNTGVKLVVLNGCRTAAVSAFAGLFPAVVGMQFRISDAAAIAFSKGLYTELADCGQLDFSVYHGRNTIFTSPTVKNRSELVTPVLYSQSDDGLVFKVRPQILSDSLAPGHRYSPYSQEIRAKGGRRPYTWKVLGLPRGIESQVDGNDTDVALVKGSPTVSGKFLVIAEVTSYDGLTGSARLPLLIDAGVTFPERVHVRSHDFVDHAFTVLPGESPQRCETQGLPSGLQCRPWGAICGIAPAGIDGTAAEVAVVDAQMNRGRVEVKFIADSLDSNLADFFTLDASNTLVERDDFGTQSRFSPIPGGAFILGYQSGSERDQLLQALSHRFGLPSVAEVLEKCPEKLIHLNGYLMQQYEVTNREYKLFVDATNHLAPPHWNRSSPPIDLLDHPVVKITFEDAQAYCTWKTQLAQIEGLNISYELPSNWEFEKAAKGPTQPSAHHEPVSRPGRLYPWGDEWGDNLNHLGTGHSRTVSVNEHSTGGSALRVHDWGNVSEWIDGGKAQSDGVFKHIRGASFRKSGEVYALTFQLIETLGDIRVSGDDLGFRCVIHVPPAHVPKQALVPLGDDSFIDGRGDRQFIGKYKMARFAVTNAEFSEFDENHEFEPSAKLRPVTNVSKRRAEEFCKWKSRTQGLRYQLPTRLTWERACRGRAGQSYPWGNEYCKYFCNSVESGWGRTIDCWTLSEGATAEGIYSLCGNTFEWLSDGGAVGGSWRSTCEVYGAPPYPDGSQGHDGSGRDDIGFRYVVYE